MAELKWALPVFIVLYIVSLVLGAIVHYDITDFCDTYGTIYQEVVNGGVEETLKKNSRACHLLFACHATLASGVLLSFVLIFISFNCCSTRN